MKQTLVVLALLTMTASTFAKPTSSVKGPQQVMGIRYSAYFCKNSDNSIILTPERLIIINGLKATSGKSLTESEASKDYPPQVVDPIINIPNLNPDAVASDQLMPTNQDSTKLLKFGGEGFPDIKLEMRASISKTLHSFAAAGVCDKGSSAYHDIWKFKLRGHGSLRGLRFSLRSALR